MKKWVHYLTYIIAGIRNKPGRNLATAFCFAFIAASIFSGQYLIGGAVGSVDQGVSRLGADYIVAPAQYSQFLKGSGPDNTFAIVKAMPSVWRSRITRIEHIRSIQGVAMMSPQLYVSTINQSKLSSSPVDIFGIDPNTDFTIQPWLQQPLKTPLAPGEVIVGSHITGEISSHIQIFDKNYIITGRLDPTRSDIDNTIFMGLDDAYQLAAIEGVIPTSQPAISSGDINAVLIRVLPGEDPDVVGVRMRRSVSPLETTVIGRHFTLDPVTKEIHFLPGLLNTIALFIIVASFPLIALIAAMVAHERQREIGILKTMGAKRRVIFLLVIAESLFLATIGGIAGLIISFTILILMNTLGILNSALQVSFRMPLLYDTIFMAGTALIIVITIGSLSSLYPAYMSGRMNPYDAIRREGQ